MARRTVEGVGIPTRLDVLRRHRAIVWPLRCAYRCHANDDETRGCEAQAQSSVCNVANTASPKREDDHKHPVLIERKYGSNHVDDQVRLNIDQDEIVVDYPVSELLGQNW